MAKNNTQRNLTLRFKGDSGHLSRNAAQTVAAVGAAVKRIDKMRAKIKVEVDNASVAKAAGAKAGLAAAQGVADGIASSQKTVFAGLQGVLSNPAIGPIVTAALVAVAIPAAVAVGGLLAAALAGSFALAIGGGLLAAGVVAALRDPKIRAEASAMVTRIKTAFSGVGDSLKRPLITALGAITSTLETTTAPSIKRAIDSLTPSLTLFGQMVNQALGSVDFAKLAAEVRPFLDAFSRSLPGIAKGLTDFISLLLTNKNTLKSWQTLLNAIPPILRGIAAVLNFLADSFQRGITQIKITLAILERATRGSRLIIELAFRGISAAVQAAGRAFSAIASTVSNAIDRAVSAVRNGMNAIKNLLRQALPTPKLPSLGGLLGRATGGTVVPGQAYSVGSEVFVPSTTGRIFAKSSAEKALAGNGGGGSDINVNVDFTGVPVEIQRMINVSIVKNERARQRYNMSGRL